MLVLYAGAGANVNALEEESQGASPKFTTPTRAGAAMQNSYAKFLYNYFMASSISRVKNAPSSQPWARACWGTMLAGEMPGMVFASSK